MKIITFPQWLGAAGRGGITMKLDNELPPLILNPIFADLYYDEYDGQ
jgi:hypothetical protein